MLLTLHNLPPDMRYSDIKSLLRDKCGLTELVLDNLLPTGSTKKVTIGVPEEADAAIIVRKINGLHIKGQQLYVEDIRKKRKANEQPFRSSELYYSADTIKEIVPEPAAIQPYVDPQIAYQQMNYAMMAGMYGGYMPPVQDPNYDYAAQSMSVMPVMSAALSAAGMPVNNQTNDWQTSQSQRDPWQNTQGRAEPRQAVKDREDPWNNPQTRDSFRKDRSSRDESWQNSQGFRQERKGRDDSRQNHPTRESFRQKSGPREDPWQNTNMREGSRHHKYSQERAPVDKPIQERPSRWASEQSALLETPIVEDARPYFDHGHSEIRGRPEMRRRDERRRSPDNRRWDSNDRDGFGQNRNDFSDDRRQRSPHVSGRYEPEPKILHYTVNSVNVDNVMDRGFVESRRTERHISAEPVRYDPRSPERDNSRPRPFRAKRGFEEPPRPFRGDKRARYDEPFQAPMEDRPGYDKLPALIENRGHRNEPRHSRERPERRFKEGPSFNPPRAAIEEARPPVIQSAAKMMRREETYRQQTAAKIAKIMTERSPTGFSQLFTKILKQTIRIRLDRILRDEYANEPADMLRRYTEKFPRGADGNTIKSVSKRVDLVMAEREMQISQSNNDVPADVEPQVTPLAVQAPRRAPATVVKDAPAPNKSVKVPKGVVPKFPNGDKARHQQQKQMRKLESQHDDLYPLSPPTKAALDTEMEAITNIIKEECADPTEEDKITCERIKTETVDDMEKVVGTMVSKRLLNDMRTGLQVRMYFAGGRKPKGPAFEKFLKEHGVVCSRKSARADKMLITECNSYDNYDKLLSKRQAVIDGITVQIMPLNLLDPKVFGRRRNLSDVHGMRDKRKKFVSDQVQDFDEALAAYRDPTVKRVKTAVLQDEDETLCQPTEDGDDENGPENGDNFTLDQNYDNPDEDFVEMSDDVMTSDNIPDDVFANMPEDFVMPGENDNLPDDDFVEMPDDGEEDIDFSHINEEDLEDY